MTTMMGVPANYLFMARGAAASRRPTSRRCGSRSSAARRCRCALLDTWAARGVEIVQGYGLTEAAPNVLCLPPEDARRKAGSAGQAVPVRRVPTSSAEGELLVRGPNVFAGYWRNPEATAAAFRDGWLLDRRRRRARRRGRLLDPRPAQGDGRLGRRERLPGRDRGRARTSTRPWSRPRSSACPTSAGARSAPRSSSAGAPVDEDELRAFCRERLARFKVPKSFHARRARCRGTRSARSQKDELARDGGDAHDRRRARAPPAGRSRSAASTRAGACSTRPSRCFGELGYHDASIVKITEAAGVAQGTFYLYFDSKKAVFDELVRDLNQRVRHAMKEGSSRGETRLEAELLGFAGVLPLHRRAPGALPDHPPGRVRLAGDAPLPLRAALGRATSRRCSEAVARRRDRRRRRPRGDRLGADGPRRADRDALDPLERRDASCRDARRRASSSASSAGVLEARRSEARRAARDRFVPAGAAGCTAAEIGERVRDPGGR